MNIPRYWAKGDSTVQGAVTHPHSGASIEHLSCWGWSDSSEEDARAKGVERANALHQTFESGEVPDRYGYPDRPMREEIIDEWKDSDGTVYAAITLNGYGCQVLNTASIMFIDVDLEPEKPGSIFDSIGRLFGGKKTETVDPETEALNKARSLSKADPELGIRAYRTAAGLRYLVTHTQKTPDSEDSQAMMSALGSDPLYMRLCKVQDCFRARLTPKPWRCGSYALNVSYPYTDTEAEKRAMAWLEDYQKHAASYATCTFIHHYGPKEMSDEIQRVVSYHDDLTGATSGRPLA